MNDIPVSAVYADIFHERQRAHTKHGAQSLEYGAWNDPTGRRMRILIEEVGEVAKVLNDAELAGVTPDHAHLYEELIQAAACATAWADAVAADLRKLP